MNGSWKPTKARRAMIPQKKKGEFRTLTILAPSDRTAAGTMKIVHGAVFEKHKGPVD